MWNLWAPDEGAWLLSLGRQHLWVGGFSKESRWLFPNICQVTGSAGVPGKRFLPRGRDTESCPGWDGITEVRRVLLWPSRHNSVTHGRSEQLASACSLLPPFLRRSVS